MWYRSALDELAGRGGRGPEDDPFRLTARGLLQFLRARGHEKSLAAAPADLLPASIVCQVAYVYEKLRTICCSKIVKLGPSLAEMPKDERVYPWALRVVVHGE